MALHVLNSLFPLWVCYSIYMVYAYLSRVIWYYVSTCSTCRNYTTLSSSIWGICSGGWDLSLFLIILEANSYSTLADDVSSNKAAWCTCLTTIQKAGGRYLNRIMVFAGGWMMPTASLLQHVRHVWWQCTKPTRYISIEVMAFPNDDCVLGRRTLDSTSTSRVRAMYSTRH